MIENDQKSKCQWSDEQFKKFSWSSGTVKYTALQQY
jgi:hypothetical protein